MTILQHSLGDTSVLCVHGALRAPVDTALRLEVDALIRRGQRRLLLDLTGVSGLDAAGVGELVRVYNMAVAANGTLRVAHVLGKNRELLVWVGLINLLTMDAEPGSGDRHGAGQYPNVLSCIDVDQSALSSRRDGLDLRSDTPSRDGSV